MDNIAEAQRHLDKVKIQLMLQPNLTFFISILFSLRIRWDTGIPMVATNGVDLFINPVYWLTRTIEGGKADLIHEVMHVVLNHMQRCTSKLINKNKYNLAGDYVINLMLKKMGLEVDSTFVLDYKYKNMSTEQVYNLMPDPPADYNPDVIPENKESDKTPQELDEHIKNMISTGITQAEVAKDYGSIPENLRRDIKELLDPKLPWHEILNNYMSAYNKDDYTWSRPNRRFEDIYLPSQHSQAMNSLSCYIDCSGSVTDKEYTDFLTEIQEIKESLNPVKTTVVNWGTEIGSITNLTQEQELMDECELQNLGGTNIGPVIEHINTTLPEVAIIFTDGCFSSYKKEAEVDVFWIIIGFPNFKTTFGEVIDYDN